MTLQQITATDITGWNSLQDIARSFEKRGLKPRPHLGEDYELVLQLTDDEFVVLVNAGPGEPATDFKPDNRSRHTNLVATNDFEKFTFLTRMRGWEGQQHGRIKHQKISFSKDQFTSDSGEKNTVLKKLNSIEYGSSAAIYDTLYDTQQVVKEFYEEFEVLRTNLVQEVSGIPVDRGDAKQRYVQVILDRMIFLYFIQEKRLLDRNPKYLHEHPGRIVDEREDRYENFYRPLFFDYLAEDKQNPDFGSLPYLNGGLFAKNPVEEDFPDAKLGASTEKTNELFDDILNFLSGWNWNVDERLDIVDPKNLSPAILGHIFEQTVNQKEMGAYYTPEEITGFMSRRTIHPYLLDQLNDAVDAEYDEIDDVFGFSGVEASSGEEAVADSGTMTRQVPTENVETEHVETLYHDILKEAHILDPAVGSGAFLLAAQDVLVDIYIQCIEYFQQVEQEGKSWELKSRTRDELGEINEGQGGASLYTKRSVILNNLYGVDIDEGAVEICKLRLWLSMVADLEDEPNEVEPLPNIDFNIRQGNSLIGFTEITEVNTGGDKPLTNWGGGAGASVEELYEDVIEAITRYQTVKSGQKATEARRTAEELIDTHSKELDEKIRTQFEEAGVDDFSKEDLADYSPFHWVLEFASVYQKGGFDVIIGNPPYIRIQELKKSQPEMVTLLKNSANFETPYYNYDIAIPFVERCEGLLGDFGRLSFIMTNKWIQARYGAKLRGRLAQKRSIEKLVDFTDQQVFEGISTYVLTLFLTADENESIEYSEINEIGDSLAETVNLIGAESQTEWVQNFEAAYEPLGEKPWTFLPKREGELLDEINVHPTLGDITERIFVGIQTSKDDVYILDIEEEHQSHYLCYSEVLEATVEIEKAITKPLLKGNQFDKWYTSEHNKVVIFPYRINKKGGKKKAELLQESYIESECPNAHTYLTKNKSVLEQRGNGDWEDSDSWYEFGRRQNIEQFGDEKIMTSVLNKGSKFSLDKNHNYVFVGGGNAGGYGLRLPDNTDLSHKYLLAILNSRLLEWIVQKTSSQFRGGYHSYGKKYIEGLPVAHTNHIEVLERLVEDLRSVVNVNCDDDLVTHLENVIDVLVYALYLDKNQFEDLIGRIETLYTDSDKDEEYVESRIKNLRDDNKIAILAQEVHRDERVKIIDEGKSRDPTFE